MLVNLIFFTLIIGFLIWVTITGRDFYPFSHYPMFSASYRLNEVSTLRVALVKQNLETEWWQHEAYRYPQYVGEQLKKYYQDPTPISDMASAILALNKRKLLIEVLRLMELEGYDLKQYQAFCIVERRVDNNLQITDLTLDTIPIITLLNGKAV